MGKRRRARQQQQTPQGNQTNEGEQGNQPLESDTDGDSISSGTGSAEELSSMEPSTENEEQLVPGAEHTEEHTTAGSDNGDIKSEESPTSAGGTSIVVVRKESISITDASDPNSPSWEQVTPQISPSMRYMELSEHDEERTPTSSAFQRTPLPQSTHVSRPTTALSGMHPAYELSGDNQREHGGHYYFFQNHYHQQTNTFVGLRPEIDAERGALRSLARHTGVTTHTRAELEELQLVLSRWRSEKSLQRLEIAQHTLRRWMVEMEEARLRSFNWQTLLAERVLDDVLCIAG